MPMAMQYRLGVVMSDDKNDPPIIEQEYIAGVRVVDIGDYRVARGMTRRAHNSCPHCQEGLFPEDFKNDTGFISKSYALESLRRRKRHADK